MITNLLTKLAVAVGPIPRKTSVQFANLFPPQPADDISWLAIVDKGKYAESWEEAGDSFQRTISKEEWVARLEKVRRPLGKVISRKLRSIKFPFKLRSIQDAAVGTRLEQKFNTSFDGLPAAVETVVCSKQPDGNWRITGYLIRLVGWRKYRGRLLLVFPFALLLLLAVFLALKDHCQISEVDTSSEHSKVAWEFCKSSATAARRA